VKSERKGKVSIAKKKYRQKETGKESEKEQERHSDLTLKDKKMWNAKE